MNIENSVKLSSNRYRKLFPFQLDLNKPDEHQIAEQIIELKQKRSFSKTIRDGIRLICDLRNGHIEVLKELFPWVLEQQLLTTEVSLAEPTNNPEDTFKPILERIENLFLQQNAAQNSATSSNLKHDTLLQGEHETAEIEFKKEILSEEEQFEKDYKRGELGGWNTLIDMNIGLDGDTRNLDDEIVLYALRKPVDGPPHIRPIPKRKLAEKHQGLWLEKDKPRVKPVPKKKEKEEEISLTDGPKAISISQFETPDFDNLEI